MQRLRIRPLQQLKKHAQKFVRYAALAIALVLCRQWAISGAVAVEVLLWRKSFLLSNCLQLKSLDLLSDTLSGSVGVWQASRRTYFTRS